MKPYRDFFKRAIDIVASGSVLLMLSLPLAAVTVWLQIANKGAGAFFLQERPGKGGKIFRVVKFKTMTDERDAYGKLLPDAKRLTRVGRFVRSTSIDELPQLWNVLKGDMSLIGPRPERPLFVEKFKEEIPRYMIKHQVRPGMTGWAQVCGFRGDTSIEGRIEHDIFYIENWTLSFDIKILFLTVFKGFVNKNAY